MPQITTVNAPGKTTAYRAPNIRADDLSALGVFGESVSRFGNELANISEKLRNQQDEIDAAGMIGEYNSVVKELAVEVDSQVADPNERPKAYAERLNQRVNAISSSVKSNNARGAFQRYVARNRPVNVTDYHMTAIHAGIQKQNARMDALGDEYSRAAALATTPEHRDQLIQEYLGLLDKAEGNLLRSPEHTQKLKQAFKEKVQVDYMSHLRSTDPDKLFELEAGGTFSDVPVTKRDAIMDRAVREKASKEAKAQHAVDKAMTVWRESIERETEKRIATNTLSEEWLEEYEYALSSEKVGAYRKALRDQRAGISTGDPTVERLVHGQVYDIRQDPRQTIDRVAFLYTQGKIGHANYSQWSTYLRAEIDRRDQRAEAKQNKQETDAKQLQGRRYQEARDQIDRALKATGFLEAFDNASAEAAAQAHEELARRADYLGDGNEDSLQVFRDMMPRYVAQVEARTSSRITFLETQLGNIRTRADLKARRTTMSDDQYERAITYLEEYTSIQKELARLGSIRRSSQGKDQQPSSPAGRWQK